MPIVRDASLGRRRLLKGLACGCAFTASTARAGPSSNAPREGCALRGSQFRGVATEDDAQPLWNGATLLDPNAKDPQIRALGIALDRMVQFSGHRPAFAFFNDSGAPNAYASPERLVAGAEGTILFGRSLFRDAMSNYESHGFSVLMIIAHEFGHIAQFSSDKYDALFSLSDTSVLPELHADFLAGFYLAELDRMYAAMNNNFAARLMKDLGDFNIRSPDHHGTPDQRLKASNAGYRFGREGGLTYDGAVDLGAKFVVQNFWRR